MAAKDHIRLDWRTVMRSCDGKRKALQAREVVFRQGEPADAVYYLIKGRVKVTVISEHGKEGVIGIFQQGELLGDDRLRGHDTYTVTATTLAESELIRLPAGAVSRALQHDPQFAHWFNHFLLKRVEKLEVDIVDHLFNSSEQRLARLLLQLAHFEEDGAGPIEPPIDQQTLARMIGTTRPRVSHFMNKFRQSGYVQYGRGRITVKKALLDVVLSEPKDSRS